MFELNVVNHIAVFSQPQWKEFAGSFSKVLAKSEQKQELILGELIQQITVDSPPDNWHFQSFLCFTS